MAKKKKKRGKSKAAIKKGIAVCKFKGKKIIKSTCKAVKRGKGGRKKSKSTKSLLAKSPYGKSKGFGPPDLGPRSVGPRSSVRSAYSGRRMGPSSGGAFGNYGGGGSRFGGPRSFGSRSRFSRY